MRRLVIRLSLLGLALGLLWLAQWRWGAGGGPSSPPEPPEAYRIICYGGEKFVRCPSECEPDADGEPRCRCQDFYFQRGDEPLAYSHSLCR